jgi:hypothetical protein
MLGRIRRGWSIGWLGGAVALLIAPAAMADTRYAAHDGTGSACTQTVPCHLKTAINPGVPPTPGAPGDIQDGDTVVLLSEGSDYEFTGSFRFDVANAITVRGEPGQPRPTIESNAVGFQPDPLFELKVPGATLEGLRIKVSGDQGLALDVEAAAAPSTIRDVYVEGTELDSSGQMVRMEGASTLERAEIVRFGSSTGGVLNGETLLMVGDVLLRDSFVRNTGTQGAIRTNGPSAAARIRNVTVASGATAIFSNFQPQQVSIRNALIDGAGNDISAATTGDPINVTVTHSNYNPAQVSATGAGATVTQVAPNQDQTASFPVLVDPLFGNFHQLAGSPTINAGSPDASTGAFDIDGQPRTMGAAIDIGGDEFFESEPVVAPPETKPKPRCRKGFKLKKIKPKKKGKKPKKKCVKKKRKKKKR